ncbi:MAG: hypothetical protein ACRCTR_09550 [Actinomycetota bacterium]
MLKKIIHGAFGGLILSFSLALPANAASFSCGTDSTCWTSYFTEWNVGKKSRNWNDETSSNSTVLSIKDCTYTLSNSEQWITFRLHRDDTFTPDENYELKGIDCWPDSSPHYGTWSSKGTGTFYWKIRYILGYDDSLVRASTSSIRVNY